MFGLRFPATLLALLALRAVAADDDDESPTTTAPIYLPGYDEESWSLLRGSVVSSDAEAQQTTYTIFCLNDDPDTCDISLEVPFVVVEGPDTVIFHGTYTSTYIANLECTLDGTTAATCSGYSSYKDGYCNGLVTGPTELSWTSTYTRSQVEYGVLTMAEPPKETQHEYDVTGTAEVTPTGSGYVSLPLATETGSEGAGARLPVDGRTALLGALGSTILARVLF